MKTVFTAEANSPGGCSGTLQSSPDGLLNVVLGNPLELGSKKRSPNPERLFAGANAVGRGKFDQGWGVHPIFYAGKLV